MAAYPDETNPVRVMNEKETRRLSIASAQKVAQATLKTSESDTFFFWDKTRILIALLVTACLTICVCNSLALNFTVICMFDETAVPQVSSNQTTAPKQLLYTDAQTSWLFSAIAIGCLIGTSPISYLTNRFGFRKTFVFYGLSSGISTLLLPLAVQFGFGFTMIARIIEGIAVGSSFPAMGSVVSDWATLKRSGSYFAYISTHLQLGQVITMPLAGELCESVGWASLYYLLGTITLIFFALFFWFYRDSPAIHRNVSHKELTQIQKNKFVRVLEEGERVKVPYKAMFTDKAVLGCLISSIGGGFGFLLFVQYGPIFLNKVLGFDVKETGFAAALPFLLSMFVKFAVGPLSDSFPYLSDRWRMIVFASGSQFGMGICMFLLAFVPADKPLLAQVLFTSSTVLSGLNAVGVSKSAQVISGSFAYVTMTCVQLISALCQLSIPLIVAVFCPDNTREEWARLFIATAILLFVVTVIFNITCEASPRPWTCIDQPKLPAKVAPIIEETPGTFDIAEEKLSDLKAVDEILEKKRLSIISGHRSSNLGMYEVSLGESKVKDNSMNV
ncbi:hypothetical protein M3Y97_00464600 [Aphelenchoides bicaudatus]|nr:hypothetical protein M3Y97_00464600 [Aphelenchoides bicaudatus]